MFVAAYKLCKGIFKQIYKTVMLYMEAQSAIKYVEFQCIVFHMLCDDLTLIELKFGDTAIFMNENTLQKKYFS